LRIVDLIRDHIILLRDFINRIGSTEESMDFILPDVG